MPDLSFGEIPEAIELLKRRINDLVLSSETCRILLMSRGYTTEEFQATRAEIDSGDFDEATLVDQARRRRGGEEEEEEEEDPESVANTDRNADRMQTDAALKKLGLTSDDMRAIFSSCREAEKGGEK